MPLSVESEIDLLYHLSTMSEHVLPKGLFYLLLWKRLNQSGNPPAFSFNEMIEHLRILYDESVFDNPELPSSHDQDFQWQTSQAEIVEHKPQLQSQPQSQPTVQQTESETSVEKDSIDKVESTPKILKTRKRATSPSSNGNASTPNTDSSRRSSRQRNPQTKDEEEPQATPPPAKVDKRKSTKEPSRASTRSTPATDSIGTRLRGQK